MSQHGNSGGVFNFMGYGKPFIIKAVLQWVIQIDFVLPEFLKEQFSLAGAR